LCQPEFEIELSDEEVDEFYRLQHQEEIDDMNHVDWYNYEFDQRFSNVTEELLQLTKNNLKDITKKIN